MNDIYDSSFLMSEKDVKTAEKYIRIDYRITQKILQVNFSKDQLYWFKSSQSSIPDLPTYRNTVLKY